MGLFVTLAMPTAPMKFRSRRYLRDPPALAEDPAPVERRDQFLAAEFGAALRVRADRRTQAGSQKRLAGRGPALSW